jgi:hypothetical protein
MDPIELFARITAQMDAMKADANEPIHSKKLNSSGRTSSQDSAIEQRQIPCGQRQQIEAADLSGTVLTEERNALSLPKRATAMSTPKPQQQSISLVLREGLKEQEVVESNFLRSFSYAPN